MKLSENFRRKEFKCKCGNCTNFDTVDVQLIELCEIVRKLNGNKKLTVISGHRCPKHNRKVGGAQNSLHKLGRAADLAVDNPKDIYDKLCQLYPDRYGFGLYKHFIHVDTRKKPARWKKL